MKSLQNKTQTVISASRRTDIPAFYMEWFMSGLKKGFFSIHHPFHNKKIIIPVTPEKVHTIIFWSKNYGPFIHGQYAQKIQSMGYNIYLHFTINSPSEILEPGVPLLEDRLYQLKTLGKFISPEMINWRFDPICKYQLITHNGEVKSFENLNSLELIAQSVSEIGINRCVTSFMSNYKKIQSRIKKIPNFRFVSFTQEEKVNTILKIEKILQKYKINLFLCCEKNLLSSLPKSSLIKANECIPNNLLMKHYGGHLSLRKDYGQRIKKGCKCNASRDVGDYLCHPCLHECLYCYSNK